MAVSAETHDVEDVVGDDDRRSHETPYVQDVGGEFSLIKNPAASELPGLAFGDSNQALHMKVPGTVPAVGRMSHEVEKLRRELRNRTVQELEAALRRQKVILGNRALMARLADHGERSRQSVVAIELLLEERKKENSLYLDMEKLKINTDKMEWKNRLLDSDDDSDPEHEGVGGDPLAVLAQGVVPPSSSRARETSDLEVFAQGQADRVDEVKVGPRFSPHNSVRQSVLDPALRKLLGGGEGREEASPGKEDRPATPNMPLPPLYTCKAQSLSLGDSLKLQQEQEKTLREVQTKHAHARLAAMRQEVVVSGCSQKKVVVREEEVEVARFQDYRDPGEESQEEEEEDDDEGVGVVGVTGAPEEEEE